MTINILNMERETTKVLLIDDDTLLGNILTTALTSEGYEVHYQSSLTGLRAVVREFQPNIAVLDIEVGTGDGIASMPDLKRVADTLPVIIISSHTDNEEVRRALQQGAVVYLKKPIDVYEMMAYIDRYAHDWKPSVLHIGQLELNVESHILTYRGKEVKRLTRLEYGVLALLYENRGKVVSYTDFSELWEDGIMSEASLQNYISRLRKALADDSAVSLDSSGKGYVLVFD